ncbi:hypothetical protein F5Y16DRAFT_65877 [Xylariaceae sp. FL0255]|nr:hypothetical protein F5Y16DRAFT_65877 [Xylariaceae sp. FL0255]
MKVLVRLFLIRMDSANLQLMKETSAKYDEKQVFQKLQNGGSLLRDIKQRTQ